MYPDHRFPITDVNESERKFGVTHLRPTWEKPPEHRSPLLNFKWEPTYEALQRTGEGPASPYDDVCFEYLNPSTGGPGAAHHELHHPDAAPRRPHPGAPPGAELGLPGLRRQGLFGSSAASGSTGRRGTSSLVPPWAWHEHANETDGETILFAIHDAPVMKALGLYREEGYTEGDGHQEITASFEA